MTVIEYINKKQEILKANGVTTKLVPDDQLVECEQIPLFTDGSRGNGGICPYCLVYYSKDIYSGDSCTGCPMDTAGNNCSTTNSATASTYLKVIRESTGYIKNLPGMKELVLQYNKELNK